MHDCCAVFCAQLSLLRSPVAAAMHDLKAHRAIKRGDTLQLSKQGEQTSDKRAAKKYEAHTHTSGAARFVYELRGDKLAAAAYAVFAHMNGARRIFNNTDREPTCAHDPFCVCQSIALIKIITPLLKNRKQSHRVGLNIFIPPTVVFSGMKIIGSTHFSSTRYCFYRILQY